MAYDNVILKKDYSALILCLGDRVLRKITKETTAMGIWKKLETLYMTKSLANRLYLKKNLYTFQMHQSKSQSEYIDEFHKLVGDLVAIDIVISDKDLEFLLLTYLPLSYDNLNMTEAKGDGGEGLYVRRRSGQRDMEQGTYSAWSKSQGRSSRLGCYICQSEEHLKMDSLTYNHKKSQGCVRIEDHVSSSGANSGNILLGGDDRECRVRGICKVQVHMRDGSSFVLENVRYVLELRRNLISLGTLEKEGFTVKMQSGKIKVIKGSLVVLSGTRRANCVYIMDGQAVTKKTLKDRKQLGEYQTGNMGFNESKEYKKTFIGSGVDDSGFLGDARLRSRLPRFYNGKLVQTLLKAHSILRRRLDIASADVGILDKFKTDIWGGVKNIALAAEGMFFVVVVVVVDVDVDVAIAVDVVIDVHLLSDSSDALIFLLAISVAKAASRWLRNESASSIETWETLKKKFLSKYCPPAKTAKKMEEINNFQQDPDETLYQAWK
ncbi:zinc finger, CCHC-type containing protein [Tanacetum coccineum]